MTSVPAPVPALPAATVTLVRDTSAGLEVLMLQRNHQSGFMPGMFLFPGGALDAGDRRAAVLSRCAGLDDTAASAALDVESGGLGYWAAAIRESFEEAAVLLAYGDTGALVNPGEAARAGRFAEYRRRLNAGEDVLAQMLEREGLRLAVDRLTYFSHWITPVNAPRRYDTRFFVAVAPEGQEALPDNVEAIHHVWVSPAQAVERHRAGVYKMRTPTLSTLEQFAPFDTADALIAHLRAQTHIPTILPHIAPTGKRLLPGEEGYDALAAAEAQGKWKT
ncbi:MAG: putative hydrolase, beta-lactamase-like [Betaproteobacteria bacterium]|jgi:8-oxo-dGTP pyrophosphatase MutT (NUDIX family)|nr:putative hydrolase, beta-lactamase-like [Betaproteobacteria bacterium]